MTNQQTAGWVVESRQKNNADSLWLVHSDSFRLEKDRAEKWIQNELEGNASVGVTHWEYRPRRLVFAEEE